MPHQIMFTFSIKYLGLGLIAGAEELVDTYNTVVAELESKSS